MAQGKFRNSNQHIEELEAEKKRLQAKKNIITYFGGYKVEGYFGKHETMYDAENAIKFFNRIEALQEIADYGQIQDISG